jgi:hypothetical protein
VPWDPAQKGSRPCACHFPRLGWGLENMVPSPPPALQVPWACPRQSRSHALEWLASGQGPALCPCRPWLEAEAEAEGLESLLGLEALSSPLTQTCSACSHLDLFPGGQGDGTKGMEPALGDSESEGRHSGARGLKHSHQGPAPAWPGLPAKPDSALNTWGPQSL